nr:MAG TPA: hypothetical protein [Caudoviricetes sp.]DAP14289.1 MAG TPA: hypothetical protein [Caudoviricetes sp.]
MLLNGNSQIKKKNYRNFNTKGLKKVGDLFCGYEKIMYLCSVLENRG